MPDITSVVVQVPQPITSVIAQVPQSITSVIAQIPGSQGPAPTVPKYKLNEITPVAGVLTIPFGIGSTIVVNMNQDVTSVIFEGVPADGFAQRLPVYFVQDGTGGRTITGWPATMKWPSNVVPQLTSSAGAIDCFVFDTIDGGDTYLGALGAADFR